MEIVARTARKLAALAWEEQAFVSNLSIDAHVDRVQKQ